jgi:hypothetical protein
MMVELWTRQREMGGEEENDMEDRSGPDKSEVRLAWLGLEDLESVLLLARSGLIPAISEMVNRRTQEILLSPGVS